MTDSRIIDVVADLLGDTVVLHHSHLFAKLPGDPKRVSWHHDASYWPLTPSRVVSAWLAIDDTDVDNSAMQVIGARTTTPSSPSGTAPPPRTTCSSKRWTTPPTMATRRSPWRCGRVRSPCTATGSCTAPNPTAPTAAAAGSQCATFRRRARLRRLERQLRLVPRHRPPAPTAS